MKEERNIENCPDEAKGRNRFSKEERLHHRSLVEGLFRLGKSFYEFPFRVTWREMSLEALEKNFRNQVPEGIGKLQMMVVVPKKKRKRAVDRVLMRRRIREAYRLNRHSLRDQIADTPEIATVSLSLIYIHNENLEYSRVEEKVVNLLGRLQTKLKQEEA